MRVQGDVISLPADPAGGDLAAYLRVKVTAGVIALAGVTDKEIGTLNQKYISSGLGKSTVAPVLLANMSGTKKFIAAGPIAQFAEVWTAASGKVDDATPTGSFPIGIALKAVAADGDVVEVAPFAVYAVAHA